MQAAVSELTDISRRLNRNSHTADLIDDFLVDFQQYTHNRGTQLGAAYRNHIDAVETHIDVLSDSF